MHVSLYPEQPIYCRLPLLRINLAEVMLLDIYLLRIKNIELKYGRLVFFSLVLLLSRPPYHIHSPSAGLSLLLPLLAPVIPVPLPPLLSYFPSPPLTLFPTFLLTLYMAKKISIMCQLLLRSRQRMLIVALMT